MKANINKFSIAQMTSNSDGKTSGSGTAGLIMIGIGLIGFLVGVADFFVDGAADIMAQSLVLIGMGASLLGYRKSFDGKIKDDGQPVVEETTDETLNS